MRSVAVGLLALAGCYSPQPVSSCELTCQNEEDCPGAFVCEQGRCRISGDLCDSIVTPDAPPGSTCAGSMIAPLARICFGPPVPPPDSIPSGAFDTDNSPLCRVEFPEICLIVTDVVDQGVRATGSKPLVLWSAATLTIAPGAKLDASSSGASVGAAGDFAGCVRTGSAAGSTNAVPIGSGGAGGSYGTNGGRGGAMVDSNIPGGQPSPGTNTSGLRGGCQGAPGGSQPPNTKGGHGGGVIYLMAKDAIQIGGTINVSGAGAPVALTKEGGAGGGSGGMLVFDAPSITFSSTSVVLALGGSGASGASQMGNGVPGVDPTTTPPYNAPSVPGPTTPINCMTSIGGAGSTGTFSPGGDGGETEPLANDCAGGGGGGGDGRVVAYADMPTVDGVAMPPPLFEPQ